MKQHITPEQLKELAPEQIEKLREWWKPQKGDKFLYGELGGLSWLAIVNVVQIDGAIEDTDGDDYTEKGLPLLSIGQMIEYLVEHEPRFGIDYKDELTESFWQLLSGETLYQIDELADALWQAVKRVL